MVAQIQIIPSEAEICPDEIVWKDYKTFILIVTPKILNINHQRLAQPHLSQAKTLNDLDLEYCFQKNRRIFPMLQM